MAIKLNSKSARSELEPRPAPYFARVEAGLFIGYRVLSQGKGTWTARRRGDDGKQQTYCLGTFDEPKEYDLAVKAAQAWAADRDRGVTQVYETVEDVCRAYLQDREKNKSAKIVRDMQGRFNRLVFGKPLGMVKLSKLQSHHIKTWLLEQVQGDDNEDIRRSKDSANRNFSQLIAAMNMAFRESAIAYKPWEQVKKFAKVDKGRTKYLTADEINTLIKNSPDDLVTFIRAMVLTACRPGELARVQAQHFDPVNGSLQLTGKTGHRTATLSTEAVNFFKEQSRGKIGAALLLHRSDGSMWEKDYWKKLFNKARHAAGMGEDVVMYSLRHYAISKMIENGVDTFIVARLAGTSTAMIDKNYGHLNHGKTREKLDMANNLNALG